MDELLTQQEAEAFLRVSRYTLWRLRSDPSNPLPSVRIGGRVMYRRGDLVAWSDPSPLVHAKQVVARLTDREWKALVKSETARREGKKRKGIK